ncbi:MAG: histidine phosphatase family protein [Deltaproteobacteria bacterium]|nr:histidine phosphatase family protein [Deltaproteobacteria bacterium]
MTMDLLLVRHGQTDWNPQQKIMGPHPIPLNQTGIQQAQNLRDWLKGVPIHAVYSSPMARAVETASIIIEGRKNLQVMPEKGVAEIDYGKWIGMTFGDVEKKYNKEYYDYRFRASTVKVPGGEAVVDVQKRCVAAIEKMRANHVGEKVLVVSHADVLKAIIIHYLGVSLDHLQCVGSDNGSLAVYRFGTDWGDRLMALNYFGDMRKILSW